MQEKPIEQVGLRRMIEWLEVENKKRNHTATGIVWRHYDHIIDMANVILSQELERHAAESEDGYWWCPDCEEKSEYVEVHYCGGGLEFHPTPKAKQEAVEPIEELAKRKGKGYEYVIRGWSDRCNQYFLGRNELHAYLNTLPNADGKGRK